MDWAAEHARARGASWWKSFTTGKSAEMLGGIPHDLCECGESKRDTHDARWNDIAVCAAIHSGRLEGTWAEREGSH